MTADNVVQDRSNDHAYFSMMPNMLDDMLDPYQYRLYAHIKRVCGERGMCWQSTETMAEQCRMSTGKVSEVKQELCKMGLITITEKKRHSGGSPYHHINIVDIWQRNMAHSSQPRSPGELPGSQGETKKTPLEEDPKEGGATAQLAPVEESWPTEPAETEPETPPPNPADVAKARMRAKFGESLGEMVVHCREAQEVEGQWTAPEHRGLSPACATFKDATGYSPPKGVWRDRIDEHVGTNLVDLARWSNTCVEYVGCGWSPRNVKGMLDYFVTGQVPTTKPEGKRNGSTGHREQVISNDMVVM